MQKHQEVYKDVSNDPIVDSESFEFEATITGSTLAAAAAASCKNVKITIPLKFLSLEMPLINFEISLMLIWSANYLITSSADP